MKKQPISVAIPMLHVHNFKYHSYCCYRVHFLNLAPTMGEAAIVAKKLYMRKLKDCTAYAGMFVWDVSRFGGGIDSAVAMTNRSNGYSDVMDFVKDSVTKATLSEEYCILVVGHTNLKIPKSKETYYLDLGYIVKGLYE